MPDLCICFNSDGGMGRGWGCFLLMVEGDEIEPLMVGECPIPLSYMPLPAEGLLISSRSLEF